MAHLDAALFALDYWQSTRQHHTLRHSLNDFTRAWLSPSPFFPRHVRELCGENQPAEPEELLNHLDSAIAFLDGFCKDRKVDDDGLEKLALHLHQYFPVPSILVDPPKGSTESLTYVFDHYGYVLPVWHLAQVHLRTARVALGHKFAASDSPGLARPTEPTLNSRTHTDLVQVFASLEAAYGLGGRHVVVDPANAVSRTGFGPASAVSILGDFISELLKMPASAIRRESSKPLTAGLTEPNFAAILHYLGWLLDDRDVALNAEGNRLAAGEPSFVNDVCVLLVTPRDNEGVCQGAVLPARAQRTVSTGPGLILDLPSWGLMPFDVDTTRSLQIAHLIAANELEASQSLTTGVLLSLRPDAHLPVQLGGDSAGGLLAVTAVATALGLPVDRDATASFTIQPLNGQIANRVAAHDRSLRAVDFRIGPVGGIPEKLEQEPALTTRSIGRVFLSHDQRRDRDHAPMEDWKHALETKTGLAILPVGGAPSASPADATTQTAFASLKTVLDLMTGDHQIERLVRRHADAVHQKLKDATRPTADSPRSVRDDHDEHRFDKYVWPNYIHEKNALISGQETVARRETRVPGIEIDQLRTLLDWLIKDNQFLVVYDRAGAGKTVFSWQAEHQLTSVESRRLQFGGLAPLVIRCNGTWPRQKVGGALLSVREVLAWELAQPPSTSTTAKLTAAPSESTIEQAIGQLLHDRRVVFILDGFDQFSPQEREHVVAQLTDRGDHTALNQCRWIVTGRVHAIEEYNARLFGRTGWSRIRIDAFDKGQQDRYLSDLDGRWQQMVPDRKAVSEVLGLPLVLKLIRDLIESNAANEPLPVFRTLSELFVLASRTLLERAINTTAKENPEVARQTNGGNVAGERRERLEQVLATLAFDMLLGGHWNAELDNGPEKRVAALERSAQRRVCRDLNTQLKQPDLEPSDRRQYELDLDAAITNFNADLWLLKTIELNHRSITEAFVAERVAFRSRKIMECYAARFLTRYASAADLADIRRFSGDVQWTECWRLALDMPAEEMFPQQALAAFDVLFEAPNARPRPTELIYRCWFRLSHSKVPALRDGLLAILSRYRAQFRDILAGVAPVPELIVDPELGLNPRAEIPSVLGRARRAAESIWEGDLRSYLEPYSNAGQLPSGETPESWLTKITPKTGYEAYSLCSNGTTTHSSPEQKADTKSFRFLMGASPDDTAAFENEKSKKGKIGETRREVEIDAFRIGTSTVTRGQYRLFDAVRENADREGMNGKDLRAADDDCPITHVDWFDSFAYTLWLGERYGLPTEPQWEGAAWGGLDRAACPEAVIGVDPYTAGFTSEQVNHNGKKPIKAQQESEFAMRTLPVRWDEVRREEEAKRGGWVYLPGTYTPNGFGLWQMSGNAWEWCVPLFPVGPSLDELLDTGKTGLDSNVDIGMRCSVRGGVWYDGAHGCHCSVRFSFFAGSRDVGLSLRVARNL